MITWILILMALAGLVFLFTVVFDDKNLKSFCLSILGVLWLFGVITMCIYYLGISIDNLENERLTEESENVTEVTINSLEKPE